MFIEPPKVGSPRVLTWGKHSHQGQGNHQSIYSWQTTKPCNYLVQTDTRLLRQSENLEGLPTRSWSINPSTHSLSLPFSACLLSACVLEVVFLFLEVLGHSPNWGKGPGRSVLPGSVHWVLSLPNSTQVCLGLSASPVPLPRGTSVRLSLLWAHYFFNFY